MNYVVSPVFAIVTRGRLAGALALALASAGAFHGCGQPPSPGPPSTAPAGAEPPSTASASLYHRLNRVEYDNTVRDLLGTELKSAPDLPPDEQAWGFDNPADLLRVTPLHAERYLAAAERLVREALSPEPPAPRVFLFPAPTMDASGGRAAIGDGGWNLERGGLLHARVRVAADSRWKLQLRAWAYADSTSPPGSVGPARAAVSVDDAPVRTFEVPQPPSPATYEVEVALRAGSHDLYVRDQTGRGPYLALGWLRLEQVPAGGNPIRRRLLGCDPAVLGRDPCARRILGDFARRAWRRPVTPDEVARLAGLQDVAAAEGEGFEQGVALGLEAILLSPHFLFRVEAQAPGERPRPVDDHALAARLSYFLWSSTPDDALLADADAGRLGDRATLEGHVLRMLADPRADEALVGGFEGQWLMLRNLEDHSLDPDARFDLQLRTAMQAETEQLFRAVLAGELGVDGLLTSPRTWVNDRLAEHYGAPPVGLGLHPVALPQRRGILTHGSLLTVTSHPTVTSAVLRGQWILDRLLCDPPGAPPNTVDRSPIPESGGGRSAREALRQHSTRAGCAGCHASMDALGFGLDHFDRIGRYRSAVGAFPVDSTGAVEDLGRFDGAVELAGLLAADPRFGRCFVAQLATFALGFPQGDFTEEELAGLSGGFAAQGFDLRRLIVAMVTADGFRRPHHRAAP
jgi:hypothetical protein